MNQYLGYFDTDLEASKLTKIPFLFLESNLV